MTCAVPVWRRPAAAGGPAGACVGRPAPRRRAWRSAACAFGGASGAAAGAPIDDGVPRCGGWGNGAMGGGGGMPRACVARAAEACQLSSPCSRCVCPLPVPMLCVLEPMPGARVHAVCVLELCAFVLGVWCACAAFVYIVRTSLVKVVDIAGVRRPVLCAGAVHACVVRACAPHARVACACCACPCCACACCAPSCWSRGVRVQRSSTSCGARSRRRHHIPRRPRRPDMPLPILSPIALLLLAHMHVPAMLY